MDEFKPEIISAVVLTLIVIIQAFRSYLAGLIVTPIINYFKKQKMDISTVTSGRTINNLLLELRLKMSSDRGAIYLFHNGQHFHPKIINNSIWKFTCAYENCKEGLSYDSNKLQSLLVTSHLDIIESLWGKLGDGFFKHDCKECPFCCDPAKNIITVVDVDALPYGNTKSLFESQGIKKSVISPIIIGDDYVGFVVIGYMSGFHLGEQIIGVPQSINPNGIKTVCEYANKIGYHLSSQK